MIYSSRSVTETVPGGIVETVPGGIVFFFFNCSFNFPIPVLACNKSSSLWGTAVCAFFRKCEKHLVVRVWPWNNFRNLGSFHTCNVQSIWLESWWICPTLCFIQADEELSNFRLRQVITWNWYCLALGSTRNLPWYDCTDKLIQPWINTKARCNTNWAKGESFRAA